MSRPWNRLSLRTKGLLMLVVPLSVAAVSWLAITELRQERHAADEWIEHTLVVRESLHRGADAAEQAERATLSFLVTGLKDQLSPYRGARDTLGKETRNLLQLTRDNPVEQARAAAAGQEANRGLAQLDHLIETRPTDPEALRTAVIESGQTMDALRSQLDDMLAQEQGLLEQRRLDSDQIRKRQQLRVKLSLVAAAGGCLVAIFIFTTGITRRARRLAAGAAALAEGLPPIVVADDSLDEIGVVGRAMIEAGRLLDWRDRLVRESREKYRTMAHEFPSGTVSLIDTDLRYQLSDGEGFQKLGILPDAFTGRRVGEVDPFGSGGVFERLCIRALANEKVSVSLFTDDQILDVRLVPTNDANGALGGVLVTSQIITERVEAARLLVERQSALEDANRELEAFSYSVSHDLRAPLRAIDGFSQALMEDYADRVDDVGRDYLKRVRASTQRMGHLIDDLLKLSRVSRAALSREPVDLGALSEEVVAELRRREPTRSVSFSTSGDLAATGDPRLLLIVLENLLGNAWKFTGKKERAEVRLFRAEQSDGSAAFCLCDNGAGFDMAFAGKLFGAFQRMHSEREFPGTGVGLAIVARIVRRHGGRVWAESEVGKGTRFLFTLGGA